MRCKTDFPILNDRLIYLDNSSTTQKPQKVIDAITNFYTKSNANVHRGIYNLSEQATISFEKAHQTVAKFISAEKQEIIFTSGTTQSINILSNSIPLNAGDEILLTQMEHHSNLIPWQQRAKEVGAKIQFIPITNDYRLDMKAAQQLITEKTKIISVSHMSNVLGTINPIKELATLAHQHNTLLIVDAAQSAPHLPINVKELDCDFLTFSGHKMCGPTGIGVLYGKKQLLKSLQPVIFGGGMVNEVTYQDATWRDTPEKFEAGTPNIAGAIGLEAAINYLQSIGMYKIKEHSKKLSEYALQKLQTIPNLTIIGPNSTEKRGAVFSFTLSNIHPHDVAEILNQNNIAVRAGHHCAMPLMNILKISGTTRASFYIYNTIEDIDTLIKAIKKVQEVFS